MNFDYSPQEEAFRQELRSWLEANPADNYDPETFEIIDQEERFQIKFDWQKKLHGAGLGRYSLAQGVWWPGRYDHGADHLPAGDGPGARARISQSAGYLAGRPHLDALGNGGAESAFRSQDSQR